MLVASWMILIRSQISNNALICKYVISENSPPPPLQSAFTIAALVSWKYQSFLHMSYLSLNVENGILANELSARCEVESIKEGSFRDERIETRYCENCGYIELFRIAKEK